MTPDGTKKPLAVVTMVYEDYLFLERWYRYYAAQIGPENLYIFSHGNDPKHREMAPDANVIALPRDESFTRFDSDRWGMLSHFSAGLFGYYDWVIVADVDEILVADPAHAPTLVQFIRDRFPNKSNAPINICPLGLEIVHVPEKETAALEPTRSVLSQRSYFRPNTNYSKPCLIGRPTMFKAGGHANFLGPRHLADDLYLLHLKYVDRDLSRSRILSRKAMIAKARELNVNCEAQSWDKETDPHQDILDTLPLGQENLALPRFRERMTAQTTQDGRLYVWHKVKAQKLFKLPDRFRDIL